MAQTQHTSRLWTINLLDLGKGALVAAITAALVVIQQAIDAGGLKGINWELVGGGALAAGVGYIVKNWLTPASVNIPVESKNENFSVPVITVNEEVIVPPSTPKKGIEEPIGAVK